MSLDLILFITTILGLISIFTCAVPLIRLVFAVMYSITLFCCIISFMIGVIVLRARFNFRPQAGGDTFNPAMNFGLYLSVIAFTLVCAVPCFLCSLFQVLVSFGLFQEANEVDPGCLPSSVVNLVVLFTDGCEIFTEDTLKQMGCCSKK
jgi:hypothetical protein